MLVIFLPNLQMGASPAAAPAVPKVSDHIGRGNWHILDNVRKRRFGQKSTVNDRIIGVGLEVTTTTGQISLKSGTSTEIGGFLQIATDIDITDNSGGSATSTIASMTNVDTLTDSTNGTADDTLAEVSGSGDDATINNNFKELVDQVLTQEALNTAVINAISSLAAETNDLKAKMRTSGILDS